MSLNGCSELVGLTVIPGFISVLIHPLIIPMVFPVAMKHRFATTRRHIPSWLWKPGKPTGKATKLLTKDGEWFSYRIKVVGSHIQFWINNKLILTYDDEEFASGHFAIQVHNPGMKIEAKELYFHDLTK